MCLLLKKGFSCLDQLYEHIKSDYVLKGVQAIVDLLLDDSTKEVIRKYESNLKSSSKEDGTPLSKNLQIKIIGIKLFLIYQKAIKTGIHLKDRFSNGLGSIKTTLGSTWGYLQTFVLVEKTCVCINLCWQHSRQAAKHLINKLRVFGKKIRYHRSTKRLLVYANDVKELSKIMFSVLYEFCYSTIQLKRSRNFYDAVMSKYKALKTDYNELKQQSQILSQRILSEGGDPDVDLLDIVSKKVSKAIRNLKSEDNLYQRRKDSIKQSNGQIVEQVEDRSENLQSKLDEEEEYEPIIVSPKADKAKLRQIAQPACFMSSNRSSFNESVIILGSFQASPANRSQQDGSVK